MKKLVVVRTLSENQNSDFSPAAALGFPWESHSPWGEKQLLLHRKSPCHEENLAGQSREIKTPTLGNNSSLEQPQLPGLS